MAAGFDADRPTIVSSTGVTMYLTRDANAATLSQIASLAPGSTLATTFLLPAELLDEEDRAGLQAAARGARASGTPFVTFFAPEEMLALARDAGSRDARHVSAADLNQRYFAGRTDGLRTSRGEELLVATTSEVLCPPRFGAPKARVPVDAPVVVRRARRRSTR